MGVGTVAVISAASNSVVGSGSAGGALTGIAVNPAGPRVYVTSFSNNSVIVINASSISVDTTIGVGFAPAGIGVSPSGDRDYAANSDGTVSVFDTCTNSVVVTMRVVSPSMRILGTNTETPARN